MRDSHKGMCNLRMTNNDHCNKKRVITVLLRPPPTVPCTGCSINAWENKN